MTTSTTLKRVSYLAVLLGGVVAALYGCSSDDETTPATPKTDAGTSGTDSSTSTDTGSATDTGSVTDTGTKTDTGTTVDANVPTAVANIQPTSDASTVTGTATWVQGGSGGATVTISITGAPPGTHGLHIHAGNDCGNLNDAGPGTAAGGHWNPLDAGHAYPDASAHHLGDMGNIDIDDAGAGSLTLSNVDWLVTPTSSPNSVVNHAVVFHAGTDDGTTQPTGNSGGRIGCGVINQTQ